MLKNLLWLGAIGYTVAIAVLSLISTQKVPELGIEVSDKLLHVVAYALLTMIWFLALKRSRYQVGIIWLALSCIIYGIILEVIQDELNTHRTADVYDVLANSIGVLLVLIAIFYKQRQQVKNI